MGLSDQKHAYHFQYESGGKVYDVERNIYGDENNANVVSTLATNYANKQLAEQENQWNIDQWSRENAYNSPANQIELLKRAGLNPNIYQGGGATASQLTSASLANQQPFQLNPQVSRFSKAMNFMSGLVDIAKTGVEYKRAMAESRSLDASAGLNRANTKKVLQDYSQAKEIFPFLRGSAGAESRSKSADAYVKESSTQYLITKAMLDTKAVENIVNMQPHELKKLKAEINQINSITDSNRANTVWRKFCNDFNAKFGLPIDSPGGQVLLEYALKSSFEQRKIKGTLDASLGLKMFGVSAGGEYESTRSHFNPQSFSDYWQELR